MIGKVTKFQVSQDIDELTEAIKTLSYIRTKYEFKRGSKIDSYWTGEVLKSMVEERDRLIDILRNEEEVE